MDDLVVTGALGLIGLYLAAGLLLFAAFFVARLMFASLEAGNFGLVSGGIIAILIAGLLYMAIGCWLRFTDRI